MCSIMLSLTGTSYGLEGGVKSCTKRNCAVLRRVWTKTPLPIGSGVAHPPPPPLFRLPFKLARNGCLLIPKKHRRRQRQVAHSPTDARSQARHERQAAAAGVQARGRARAADRRAMRRPRALHVRCATCHRCCCCDAVDWMTRALLCAWLGWSTLKVYGWMILTSVACLLLCECAVASRMTTRSSSGTFRT